MFPRARHRFERAEVTGSSRELSLRGVASVDNSLVLAGAVPAALLALVADGLLGFAEKRLAVKR